jgi:hypothetical protein
MNCSGRPKITWRKKNLQREILLPVTIYLSLADIFSNSYQYIIFYKFLVFQDAKIQ